MWSRKFEKCIICGTTEIKHVAKGMCRKCYTLNTEAEHKKHQRHKRGVADAFLTKDKLFELYVEREMSLTDIGKLAGCTRVNVHYKLKKFGIDSRSKTEARTIALDKGKIRTTRVDEFGNEEEVVFQKIRYNEKFFKEWSSEMAYVLGLIYTDGNLHVRKDKSGYEIGILSFAQKDRELVEKFLKLMDCDAKIMYKKKKVLENTTAGALYYFSIGNNELTVDLTKLGLTPNKSLDMKFPSIPKQYLRHFIRGIFDGDGSVYLERKKLLKIKFSSGSLDFMKCLMEILVKEGFPKRTIYGSKKIKPNALEIRYEANQAVKFYNYFYSSVSSDIFWTKKYNIFYNYLFNKGKQQLKLDFK